EIAYDATSLNEHDFNEGSENLALQLNKHATLLIPANNYDFTDTLNGKQIHTVAFFYKQENLKIGVFGKRAECKDESLTINLVK
ncbi:MAG: hypothetical protein M3O67_01690, partial [Bacteroidota bacterium]|nr:hypothetical protein [Bacteroidota bacterium]